jgi:hypothetical protein
MRNRPGWWVIIVIMVLLDLYVFQVIKVLAAGTTEKARMIIYSVYWIISGAVVILIILLPYLNYEGWPKSFRSYVFATIIGLFLAKLVAALFFLIDDLRRLLTWVIAKFSPQFAEKVLDADGGITRSAFLSWLGMGLGGTLFGTLVYGFSNKYDYHVKRVRLSYDNLPNGFKGLKVVHISDIHSGSFTDKQAVQRGIDKILKESPDLILFTGDLVNDRATEMKDYMDVFSQLKAPLGVYSTLGNHDYGDYVAWESPAVKKQNLESLKAVHQQLGWRLLMNEHVVLEKNNENIALIGIENWSAKARFPKYGKMDMAYTGSERHPFKILMSHDPSHWDAEVRTTYPDIDLMLAGHTHGMQFGFETPFFKWSPVQWVYKQWAGLYEEGKQKLYVNRGFGFIGYPGRVGILPEITVIELV